MPTKTQQLSVMILALLATSLPAQTSFRGLDRLYFFRLSPSQSVDLKKQSAYLQDKWIAGPNGRCKADDIYEYVHCNDFKINNAFPGHNLVLREVIQGMNSLKTHWWILYDNGLRTDAWQFNPLPEGVDKTLTNYDIVSVSPPSDGRLMIRLEGSYFPNGGRWIMKGIEVHLSLSTGALNFQQAVNSFTFGNVDNLDGGPDTISVTTEKPVGGAVHRRSLPSTSKANRTKCGFRDPTRDEHWTFNWDHLQKTADCLVNTPTAQQTDRSPSTPSFIERGP